jgi:hypothetical protein
MPANQIGKLGVDAFLDSMICHDDINALKSPHTIRIGGVDMAKPEVHAIGLLARSIDELNDSDRGRTSFLTFSGSAALRQLLTRAVSTRFPE